MEYTDSSSSFNGWLEKRPRQAPKVHTLTMVIGASWRKARSGNEGVAALLKLMHETLPQSQPQAQPAHAA